MRLLAIPLTHVHYAWDMTAEEMYAEIFWLVVGLAVIVIVYALVAPRRYRSEPDEARALSEPDTTDAFAEIVTAAYAELPDDLRASLEARGIGVVIDEAAPPGGPSLAGVWVPSLRTIVIYRTQADHEVARTLMHEAAHALGFSHDQMRTRFPELMPPAECRR